ncbi:MAG: pseudouridine-5'-phosphate glycosidase [Gemmatimonadaceae bacterium]
MSSWLRVSGSVKTAIASGRPLVALESSVLAQGLMPPHNRGAAERMVAAIEERGAAPAITAIVRGVATVGLEPDELERFLERVGVRKVSARDLAHAMATGADGATTVAGTLALCVAADVQVFATGGIGGVHRDAPFDESADLAELARSPVIVVCAGAKSILDLPATIERLETNGVTVVGFRTNDLPGFFTQQTGIKLDLAVDSVNEIAKMWTHHRALKRPGAILVVQPLPAEFALDPAVVEQATAAALRQSKEKGVRGGAVTPFLLSEIQRLTNGRSVVANLALLEANAALAADIAVALQAPLASS